MKRVTELFALLALSAIAESSDMQHVGYDEPDTIDLEQSVVIYRCNPKYFGLWLAPKETLLKEGERSVALGSPEQVKCRSQGGEFIFSTVTTGPSERGYCAAAVFGDLSLSLNGQQLLHNHQGKLANYCVLSGITEVHYSDGKMRLCTINRSDNGDPVISCNVD